MPAFTHVPLTNWPATPAIVRHVEPRPDALRALVTRATAPAPAPWSNPLIRQDAPDPGIVRGGDKLYYAFTTNTGGRNVPMWRSKDLRTWTLAGDAMRRPSWVIGDMWAPDVQKTPAGYTMTYSARGKDGRMRIGYATASRASGPYSDKGVLLQSENPGYTIDSQLFQDGSRWYVYWGSGNGDTNVEGIRVQEVTFGWFGRMSLKGAPALAIVRGEDRNTVEAAYTVKRGGMYYLYYSDGHFDGAGGNDYRQQVARAASPMGPFTKLGSPLLRGGNGFTHPGHAAIIVDGAGKDWMLYHAWGADRARGRQMLMEPVTYTNGWPVVGDGTGMPSIGGPVGPKIT